MAVDNKIISTIQISFWFRSSYCHNLFAFTTIRYYYYTKLRLISSPTCLLTNSWLLRLKTLSNSCFLPIPPNGKRGSDGHLLLLANASFLTWSLANNWLLILKTLLNGRFLPILLDMKRSGDKRSFIWKKKVKVRAVSFEDAFLNIASH